MKELLLLVEALGQYNKKESKAYKEKLSDIQGDVENAKQEIADKIKNYRYNISAGKKEDSDYSKWFEKYFIEKDRMER